MPDLIVHRAFGNEVLAVIPDNIKEKIIRPVFHAAQEGPDCWSFFHPLRKPGRSKVMHTHSGEDFISSLASAPDIHAFSYCAGFICHIVLDRVFHENIEKLVRERPEICISHAWLERVLDCAEAERTGTPCSELLGPSEPLPASLLKKIDNAYLKVYGWRSASAEFVFCTQLQFILLKIFSDPKGILFNVGRIFHFKKLQTLSYYEKNCVSPDLERICGVFLALRTNARDEAADRISRLYVSMFGFF